MSKKGKAHFLYLKMVFYRRWAAAQGPTPRRLRKI